MKALTRHGASISVMSPAHSAIVIVGMSQRHSGTAHSHTAGSAHKNGAAVSARADAMRFRICLTSLATGGHDFSCKKVRIQRLKMAQALKIGVVGQ